MALKRPKTTAVLFLAPTESRPSNRTVEADLQVQELASMFAGRFNAVVRADPRSGFSMVWGPGNLGFCAQMFRVFFLFTFWAFGKNHKSLQK